MSGQLDLDYGRRLRDRGIQVATEHADKELSHWSDYAYDHFRAFVRRSTGPFMMEDFREYLGSRLVEPPSLRAFGGIAVRARKAGLIKRAGFAQVKNPKAHCTPATLWERA